MKITFKGVARRALKIGFLYYFGNQAIKYIKRQQNSMPEDDQASINGQRHDDAVANTDETYLFDFEDYEDRNEALEKIKSNIDKIMEEHTCVYVGASKDKYRLETHEDGRFLKSFLLTRTTSFHEIKEIETYFIKEIGITIIIEELGVNLTNKSKGGEGLKPGFSEYYLYIAVCDANQV